MLEDKDVRGFFEKAVVLLLATLLFIFSVVMFALAMCVHTSILLNIGLIMLSILSAIVGIGYVIELKNLLK